MDWKAYRDDLFSKIDRLALLADLNPKQRGKKIFVECPKCKSDEAFIFEDGSIIYCPRWNKCGQRETDLLELVTGRQSLRGSEFIEALRKLAEMSGLPFPDGDINPEQLKAIKKARARQEALPLVQEICTEALLEFGSPAGEFLENRGFALKFAAEQGFGYLDTPLRLASRVSEEALRELAFYNKDGPNDAWQDRLLIPIKDRHGRLHGFAGRSLTDASPKKYLNTYGSQISQIIALGLDTAAKNPKEICVVEGFLDPFQARQHGRNNVVAVGSTGNALSLERLVALYSLGCRVLVLALDADKGAGLKGLDAALKTWDEATGQVPELFVVDPALLEPHKDPDEVIRKAGIAKWDEIYKQAIPADTWRARRIAEGYDLSTSAERYKYAIACCDYSSSIAAPLRVQSLYVNFWPEVSRLAKMNVQALQAAAQRNREEKERERIQARLEKTIQEAQSKIQADPGEAVRLLKDFKVESVYEAQQSAREILASDDETLRRYAESRYIGLASGRLPTLDECLFGWRGLTCLLGESNVGKTILLGQLLLNFLEFNPDAAAALVTLEMPAQTIRRRMLSYMSGLSNREILACYRQDADAEHKARLEEAKQKLELYYYPRLAIIQETERNPVTLESVKRRIDNLQKATGCSRFAQAIDYVGLWPVPDNIVGNERVAEKFQAKEMIRLRDYIGQENPTIAVVEPTKIEPGQKLTRRNVSGSVRATMSTDSLLIWNRLSDEDIYRWYDFQGTSGLYKRGRPEDGSDAEIRNREDYRAHVDRIKTNLGWNQINLSRITIDKTRDLGVKADVDFCVFYAHNKIEEI